MPQPQQATSMASVGKAVALGQWLSLLLCGMAVCSGGLQQWYHTQAPTAQSFVGYCLLGGIYGSILASRREHQNICSVLRSRGWKYFLVAVADVEANYLIISAFRYTTVNSVQLLNGFSVPVVMLLSWMVLKVRFQATHICGVLLCIAGGGGLVAVDSFANPSQDTAPRQWQGDIMTIGGAALYGVSNVAQEVTVRSHGMVEFLGMIGLFGSFINGVQFAILEHHEVRGIDFSSYHIDLLLVSFVLCQFALYSSMPVVIKYTSATSVNLSILSTNFYVLLFGLLLFKYQFHVLYFVAFAVIVVGLVIYSVRPTTTSFETCENEETANRRTTTKQTEEKEKLLDKQVLGDERTQQQDRNQESIQGEVEGALCGGR